MTTPRATTGPRSRPVRTSPGRIGTSGSAGQPPHRSKAKGVLLIIGSSAAFGAAGACAKAVLVATQGQLSPLRLTQFRITAAAMVLLAIVAGTRLAARRSGRASAFGARARPRSADDVTDIRSGARLWGDRRLLLSVVAYGLLAFAAVQSLYYLAISRMPVGVALLIEYLAPALVALWAVLVQRRPQPRSTWIGIGLALAGLALIARPWSGLRFDGLGLAAALSAAAALAGYFLIAESIGGRVPPVQLTAWACSAAAVGMACVQPWWSFPWSQLGRPAHLAALTMPVGVLMTVVILIGTVLAYLTGIASLRHLTAPVASVLATVEVLFAAGSAWLLLGERLTAADIAGGAVLLGGALLAGQRSSRA